MTTKITELINKFEATQKDTYFDKITGCSIRRDGNRGYLIDTHCLKTYIDFDMTCYTFSYYWFESGVLKTERINFNSIQHKRHLEAGHRVVNNLEYFVPFN